MYQEYENSKGKFKLNIYYMSFMSFFENLVDLIDKRSYEEDSSLIGINPIIIFKGLHWGNIIYFFNKYGYTVHGGSISRRHKLSMSEFRLGIFLYLMNIEDKESYYRYYRDNLISSNFYDNKHENSIYNEYLLINNEILYKNKLLDLNKELLTEKKNIFQKDIELSIIVEKMSEFLNEKTYLDKLHSSYDKKLLIHKTSSKHRMVINNKIKDLVEQKNDLIKENDLNKKKIVQINSNKILLFEKLVLLSSKIVNLFKENMPSLILKVMEGAQIDSKSLLSQENLINEVKVLRPGTQPSTKAKGTKNNNFSALNFVRAWGNKRFYSSPTPIVPKEKDTTFPSLKGSGKNQNIDVIEKSYSSDISNKEEITEVSKKNLDLDINSPIFMELNRILLNSSIDNNTQMQIEKFLFNQGSLLLSNKLNEIMDINYYKLNSQVLNYLKSSIEDLDGLINNLKKNVFKKKEEKLFKEINIILKNIDNKTIISYLLGRVLVIISNNYLINSKTLSTNIAIDLAKDLVDLYISNKYKEEGLPLYQTGKGKGHNNNLDNQLMERYTLSNFKKDNEESFKNLENDEFLLSLGLYLFNTLEEVNIIKTKVIQLGKEEKHTIFTVVKEISDHVHDGLNFQSLPYKIPMIVKPNKYFITESGREILGGYLLNDREFVSPLIIKNSELKEQSKISKNNYIYKMINNMSSVGFKINEDVLNFIIDNGIKYNLIINPELEHDLELKRKENKKLSLHESKDLESFISKKNLERNIIGLALIYKNISEFFIPVRIDNRGRVYCTSDYLNYQSIELAKSLLLFSKGEKIYKNDKVALDFLKIYGANCFGNGIEKKSYDDRINWVDENEDEILNFRKSDVINKADSKLLFVAFCFEYENYKNSLFNNEKFYISHFPIQLDATCNGYQHLALLTGDDDLAKNLNLTISNNKNIPQDLYTLITLKLKEFYFKKISESECKNPSPSGEGGGEVASSPFGEVSDLDQDKLDKLNSYKKLVKLNLNRKLVKLGVMVKPYNASSYQIANYIKDNLNFNKDNNSTFYTLPGNDEIKLTNKDISVLTRSIDIVIYEEFPKLKGFVQYLNTIAKICTVLNIPIV
jgi:DNA-directed RNA polymerase